MLFDGYSDGLINMARSMPSFAGVKVPFDKFAWFYKVSKSGRPIRGILKVEVYVRGIARFGAEVMAFV